MRFVKETRPYKKDFQREERGKYRYVIREELPTVIEMLASDIPLPTKYRDHMLTGNWAGHGECHIRPDLLLVYIKTTDNILYLVGLGSHSEIFS